MEDQRILDQMKYLELLSRQFPNVYEATTEIINLEAILNLPKGTEHFLSDIHGEDEAFLHILKSGSGIIRKKIDDVFGPTLTATGKKRLAILIYYPKEMLDKRKTEIDDVEELNNWYEVTLHRLVLVLKEVSSKYTRSKVRKALPKEFQYIIEELLYHRDDDPDKAHYYEQIIQSIIMVGRSKAFIIAMSETIQRLAVDHLHIIGDIYDRGPRPDLIMDKLMDYHSVDIQWGNHDIVWMGAASGSTICIMNVIRVCARYGQLDLLEEAYGINLISIAKYAMETYHHVEEDFYPKNREDLLSDEVELCAQINKAATLLLFKLEEALSKRHPEYGLSSRELLSRIDFDGMTVPIDGQSYPLKIQQLETIDPHNPIGLSEEEEQVIAKLSHSFTNNNRLSAHVAFLFEKGSIYKVYNGNLLFHGCIPLKDDGSYSEVTLGNGTYCGRYLLDKLESLLRQAYRKRQDDDREKYLDIFWYLWTGSDSSLFGKHAMKTFERTFIADSRTHKERKNPYYDHIEKVSICKRILQDFDLNPETARIINGHVPVKVSKGESPIKAEGRLVVIDGGLAKAYQEVTGIAGYTLIYNSHGMLLTAHEPFTSAKDSVDHYVDMLSEVSIVEMAPRRVLVGDTDVGQKLKRDIDDLKLLLEAYRRGFIKTLLY